MKKIISFLIICMIFCTNVCAENSYTTINMSEFLSIGTFSEGLCAAQDFNTNKWGFVDINKNWVISPQFRSASYFKNGLCVVNTVEKESVLIDRYGEIIFKISKYDAGATSDKYYVDKHGENYILFDDDNVTLLDNNFNKILPNKVILKSFKNSVHSASNTSKTIFFAKNQGRIYNYKGVDITQNLERDRVAISENLTVTDKYILAITNLPSHYIEDYSNIGYSNSSSCKIKCFDISGNKIAEFNDVREFILDGDFIITEDKISQGQNYRIFSIPENKEVLNKDSIDNIEIKTYYSKYFTISKQNGTTALYNKDGEVLVDFGKWDTIVPLSTSSSIIVSSNGKYGLVDLSGSVIFPLAYIDVSTLSNGKYVLFSKNSHTYDLVDPTSLNTYTCFSADSSYIGYKYHKIGNKILDNNLNEIYCDDTINYIGGDKSIDNGLIKQYYSGSTSHNGFLIFNDSGIKVNLDNSRLEFDVLPVIQNGRTLVPMRTIFEALGADVEWNGETKTITAKSNDVTIKMQIGNNILTKNGVSIQMDVCPQLVDGRTMVPVRAVSDSFNVAVDWDSYTQTVSLFTN